MNDEKLDALLEAMAENTTTLIDVQKQSAATSASTKDARTYVQTIAKQTDWTKNGRAIAAVLTTALEKDHTALHAASRAAQEMRGLSVELTSEARKATDAMNDRSGLFDRATRHLLGITEAHQRGQWRRWALTACLCLLCGAVGFFARDTASDLIWSCFLGRGYNESIWYSIAPLAVVGSFCGILGFFIRSRV